MQGLLLEPHFGRADLVRAVSLSYIVADRWLSADEKVDALPLPPELCEWLRVFTNEHFVPDGPKRQRAQSFVSPQERERRAKAMRGGEPGGERGG
jgi:Protein of unknown function (DUF3305)